MTAENVYQQARMTRDHRFDGTFFIAVKTTKIFCRPICPANSPLEHNVEYFELAQQAMHSGYRPCLRCRPDSAPQSYAWKGVNTTVERACSLLHQHQQLSIEDISDKLGISSRYFRQLFQTHLGMSPKQYQLFNQVLFAKQLLHQSYLPIEHVAQASGFASARRLQDNFKKVTGLTPQQVRKTKSLAGQTIDISMAYRPPYNWSHLRNFLAVRAINGIEEITEFSYAKNFIFNQEKGYFCLHFLPEEHRFKVEITLENISQLMPVVRNIERILDINARTDIIQHQLLKAGVPEAKLIPGLRLPGVWDTFETGCRAILGQQISVKAAITLLNKLAQTLGENVNGKLYFPTPKAVAEHSLSFLKIPASRKQTLIRFADYMQAHGNNPVQDWLNIKGIGPWTVAYAKLRGLSQPDVWLDTDLVIKNQLTCNDIVANEAKPWRSYLTFQLWSMT